MSAKQRAVSDLLAVLCLFKVQDFYVAVWLKLPEHIKQAIKALVKTAGQR